MFQFLLQAVAEKEAAQARQEAALVRQEESSQKYAVKVLVQSPVLQALKDDSKLLGQVT